MCLRLLAFSEVKLSCHFELIFSGFDLESTNKTYLEGLKADIAYANSKGIEVGGYDLITWTRVVDNKWMVLKEDGNVSDSACFASGWYDELLEKVNKSHNLNWFITLTPESEPNFDRHTNKWKREIS